jgi:hypothetical protein
MDEKVGTDALQQQEMKKSGSSFCGSLLGLDDAVSRYIQTE